MQHCLRHWRYLLSLLVLSSSLSGCQAYWHGVGRAFGGEPSTPVVTGACTPEAFQRGQCVTVQQNAHSK